MTKWIPVSERLPEKDGEYLCTYTFFAEKNYIAVYRFAKDLYRVDSFNFARYKGKNKMSGFYCYSSEWGYTEADEVIAWQSLPEPYEESEEE